MVLVPRGGAWGERVAQAARDRGLDPVVVPLIATELPADAAGLDRAVGRLVASATDRRPTSAPSGGDRTDVAGYTWLVVTSATAVTVLAGREASAAALVAALPDTDGTVLFPRSEIAAPTLVDGLRSRGIAVDDVEAYRTVGTGDEPVSLDPAPDAVLVTSGSVAREIARRMTPLDPRTLVACIGPGTAADARAAGLPVHVVAPTRSAEALLDAVVETLHHPAPDQEGHP